MMWRALRLVFRAAWGLLGLIGLMVTIDTGWSPFTKDMREHGVVGWIVALWRTLVGLLTNEPVGCLTFVVAIGILVYLLVDRAKAKSKAAFHEEVKKPGPKPKRGTTKRTKKSE